MNMLENIIYNRLQIGTNTLYVFAFFIAKEKPNEKNNLNQTIKSRGLSRLLGFFFVTKKTGQYCI